MELVLNRLSALSKSEKMQLFNQVDTLMINRLECTELSALIKNAFFWTTSKKGHDYWSNIWHREYNKYA